MGVVKSEYKDLKIHCKCHTVGKNRYCVDMSLRVDQYRSHHNGKLIRLQNCHSGMNEILTINRFELSSQFITNKAGENVYAIKKTFLAHFQNSKCFYYVWHHYNIHIHIRNLFSLLKLEITFVYIL